MPVLETLAYDYCAGCIVYAGCERSPDAFEWHQYIRDMAPRLRRDQTNLALVLAGGTAPGPMLRVEMKEATQGFSVRVAVITDAPLVRGVVQAMSWFHPGYQSFAPKELAQAFAFLRLSESEAAEVQRCALELQAALNRSRA